MRIQRFVANVLASIFIVALFSLIREHLNAGMEQYKILIWFGWIGFAVGIFYIVIILLFVAFLVWLWEKE